MEAEPQSNAAPPATQSAIERLEKKRLDEQMIGSHDKAECTICIDEIYLGEEVIVLPCKHWFHGECVLLWLKEHNTCPICRDPVEGGNNNNVNTNDLLPRQPSQPFASASALSAPPHSSPRRRERRTAQRNPDFGWRLTT